MTPIQRALADVQRLAERKGLQVERDGDYLVLKAPGRNTPGGQSVPYNEDGIGYLKMLLASDTSAPTSYHRRGVSRVEAAFLLFVLAMLLGYTVGTFSPESRGITGPLTILFIVLVMLSACKLVFDRVQH